MGGREVAGIRPAGDIDVAVMVGGDAHAHVTVALGIARAAEVGSPAHPAGGGVRYHEGVPGTPVAGLGGTRGDGEIGRAGEAGDVDVAKVIGGDGRGVIITGAAQVGGPAHSAASVVGRHEGAFVARAGFPGLCGTGRDREIVGAGTTGDVDVTLGIGGDGGPVVVGIVRAGATQEGCPGHAQPARCRPLRRCGMYCGEGGDEQRQTQQSGQPGEQMGHGAMILPLGAAAIREGLRPV